MTKSTAPLYPPRRGRRSRRPSGATRRSRRRRRAASTSATASSRSNDAMMQTTNEINEWSNRWPGPRVRVCATFGDGMDGREGERERRARTASGGRERRTARRCGARTRGVFAVKPEPDAARRVARTSIPGLWGDARRDVLPPRRDARAARRASVEARRCGRGTRARACRRAAAPRGGRARRGGASPSAGGDRGRRRFIEKAAEGTILARPTVSDGRVVTRGGGSGCGGG